MLERKEVAVEISEFASKQRLRVRLDSCGEAIIPGRPRSAPRPEDRNHIYEHSQTRLGIYLRLTPKAWGYAKKRLLIKGLELRQDGDSEGTLLFDPENPSEARAAIRETGARERREASPQQIEQLNKIRPKRGQEADPGPKSDGTPEGGEIPQ